MNTKDTVQALMDSIQSGDFETAGSLLSDDFQFSGPVPEPINGEQWMGISKSMRTAFPDLNYRFKIVAVVGDVVGSSNQLSGTHSGDLDLTALGMGVIPSTGKSFSLAKESAKSMVCDGKVVSLRTEPTEGAGLSAILKAIGVPVPAH
jgi:predicted ester cyclase